MTLRKTVCLAMLLAAPLPAFAEQAERASPHHHQHSADSDIVTLRQLRRGSNVIFFRHERTDVMHRDDANIIVADCSTQRNLSVAGIANSRETGDLIRVLEVPVDEVWASPVCRAFETARYAFRRVKVEPELFRNWSVETRDGPTQARDFRALVAKRMRVGKNVVLVGHFTGGQAYGVHLQEGDALVLTSDGRGGSRVVGVIGAHRWGDLVRDEGRDQPARR